MSPAAVGHEGSGSTPDPAESAAKSAAESAPTRDWEAVVGAIGPKVRDLRQAGGLSLQQLARRADVSAAAIHKVERAEMVPTITTLLKLAGALDRPLSYFVPDGEPLAPLGAVVRGADRPSLPALPGTDRRRISGPAARFAVRGEVLEIDPGAGDAPVPTPGEDLVLVLDGTLGLTVDDEHYDLGAGDSLHYPTDHAVRWSNTGRAVVRAVWLSAPSASSGPSRA